MSRDVWSIDLTSVPLHIAVANKKYRHQCMYETQRVGW